MRLVRLRRPADDRQAAAVRTAATKHHQTRRPNGGVWDLARGILKLEMEDRYPATSGPKSMTL